MKKIIIISYFFPPCNLTASQRAFSWAKYLSHFGFYPIVITRRWDNAIKTLSDVSKATPQEVKHEKNDGYEVYYLPLKQNLRDKIYAKYGNEKLSTLRRALTLAELFLQNLFTWFLPYSNFFSFAEDVVRKDSSIQALVISGNPFHQFKLGYLVNKKYGLPWIADYRDAWTTSEINSINRNKIFSAINHFDRIFEKKWVSTASCITASSSPIGAEITRLTGVPSQPIFNGFVQEDFNKISIEKFEHFTITYVGTLYHGQKVEILCNAFKKLISQRTDIKARLLFPGLSFYKDQEERIRKIMSGYERYFECTERMDRSRILQIERNSHLLFHVAWDEQKGIIASKIYEYIASGTPIIVTPGDGGSIDEIVKESGCGFCTYGIEDTFDRLSQSYDEFENGIVKVNDVNQKRVQQFSRLEQANKLAEILKSIQG